MFYPLFLWYNIFIDVAENWKTLQAPFLLQAGQKARTVMLAVVSKPQIRFTGKVSGRSEKRSIRRYVSIYRSQRIVTIRPAQWL